MARKKKDEMLDLSNRIFPYPANFLEAFPKLAGGQIEYTQTGSRGVVSYSSEAPDQYMHTSGVSWEFPVIPCNQSCKRGGFELWDRINLMVADRKIQGAYELRCPGLIGAARWIENPTKNPFPITRHNKSDASGGSVFRIKPGAAKVA